MVKRSAFTIIELIFAIVVVAIAVLSLPMMNQVIAKNNDDTIIQEAIFAAATELNDITTAHWDENSVDPTAPDSFARVIDIDGDCQDDPTQADYRRRPGHITASLHRRCLQSSTTTASNSDTNDDVDALEDEEHGSEDLFLNETPSASGYKQAYKSTLDVSSDATFGGASNSNVKKIEVTVTNDDATKTICQLRSYSANIGEIDYYHKEY